MRRVAASLMVRRPQAVSNHEQALSNRGNRRFRAKLIDILKAAA